MAQTTEMLRLGWEAPRSPLRDGSSRWEVDRRRDGAPLPATSVARGFTMVEIMFSLLVVALLIGLLLVGVSAMNRTARRAVERQNVTSLKMGVDHFRDTFGFLPPLVYDGETARSQPPPFGLTGGDPVQDRRIGGISRPAPAVYNVENLQDRDFLRGDPAAAAHERYSARSLPYYLIGALGADVDGVDGPGFAEPLPDGAFRLTKDQSGDWTGAGRRTEPLFDISKNAEGLYTEDLAEGRVELRDRNGVAYRYYRWVHGNADGEITESDDLNIPALLGEAADEPQLRSATYAIVAAGPNRAFGEVASEGGQAELALKLGMSAGESEERLEAIGRQDNIVEVGQ